MPVLLRKIIITFALIVLILFLALTVAAWIMGAFDSVQITETSGGPYYFISFDSQSGFQDIPANIQEIKNLITLPPETEQISAAMILSNPMMIPLNEVEVIGGLIVSDSISVSSPLQLTRIEKRSIISATLEANPSIAIFKTYPALSEWLRKNDREYKLKLPFIEIYYNDDKVIVEMTIVPLEAK